MIIVNANVYQKFYEIFRKKYYDEVIIPRKPQEPPPIDSLKLWEANGEKEQYLINEIIEGKLRDHTFFYRLYKETDSEFVIKRKVNDVVRMTNALLFIGIKIPIDKQTWEQYEPADQAVTLMNQFIKENRFKDQKNAAIQSDNPNSQFLEVKEIVEKYHQHLADLQLEAAWSLIAPEFQNKSPWFGDYKVFEIAFHNTITRKNIILFNFTQSSSHHINCYVYYESIIDCYHIDKLNGFDQLKVRNLNEIVERITHIREHFESNNISGFEKIEFQKLFDPSVADHILYKCNCDPANPPEIFENQKNERVKRLYKFTCKFYGDRWLISNFDGLKTFSDR